MLQYLLTRYLQQQTSPTDRALRNFHFFNTFFYEKLKEDVAYKVSIYLVRLSVLAVSVPKIGLVKLVIHLF